jgi:alginate O-acetyltransferase complex protein AlgI
MAVGLALCFGVRLPINFNSPYQAVNLIDFWRRWHISLSTFLRDYLYVPLGGNRLGETRRYLNLLTTMVLGGLWHGANWTFVIWGGLHGCALALNHLVRGRSYAASRPPSIGTKVITGILTFAFVCAAFVIFRADSVSSALNIYHGMAGLGGVTLPAQIANMLPSMPRQWHVVGTMPALGNGTVMGVVEEMMLIVTALGIAVFGRPIRALTPAIRLAVIAATAGFVVQSLFFAAAKPFIYFQF